MKQRSDEPLNYNKEKQGELFAEFQTEQAKRATYFKKGMLSGKKVMLRLSYENIVLIFISLIMLFVIFFSLGVEKGKRFALNDRKEHPVVLKDSEEKESVTAEYTKTSAEKTEIKEEIKEKVSVLSPKPYTIQVIAFKKAESAEREMEGLKNEGFDAFLIPSGNWIQVCVGRYINREASKNDFEILQKKYPKCYFRKIDN